MSNGAYKREHYVATICSLLAYALNEPKLTHSKYVHIKMNNLSNQWLFVVGNYPCKKCQKENMSFYYCHNNLFSFHY